MTILPKKKGEKDGADPHAQHNSANDRHTLERPRRPVSPQRWIPPSTHNPTHETNHNKRRHRSSPHRTVRKHRQTCSSSTSHSHARAPLSTATPPRASCSPQNNIQALEEDEETGYNSSDELIPPKHPENLQQFELWFEEAMKKRGLLIKKMGEDGACLFRAVADQVYGDQEMHSIVRKSCIDYMAKNSDFFKQYVTEDFNGYLRRKSAADAHGNHVEMQAISELYNRPVEVYQYSIEPSNIFQGTYNTDSAPIRISYHGNVHYNSLIDPYKATVGVGLGLPGYQPGLADKNLMKDATSVSENVHIEQQMLEDKLKETDWEVTQESIEEQVARESYLQWLRDNEKRAQRQTAPRSASATCSSSAAGVYDASQKDWWESAVVSPEPRTSRSPRQQTSSSGSTQNSPARLDLVTASPEAKLPLSVGGNNSPNQPSTSNGRCPTPEGAFGGTPAFVETSSLMNNLNPQIFGLSNEWDEDDIIAQVMAQSQQEYLESLKKKATATSPAKSSAGKSSTKQTSDSNSSRSLLDIETDKSKNDCNNKPKQPDNNDNC